MARPIRYIVIHCADTPNGRPNTIKDVDAWHGERGFRREPEWRARFNPDLGAVGYQYVIGINGELWPGRHVNEVPAAVGGYNSVSINICLLGKDHFTASQWNALKTCVEDLRRKFPQAEVKGHYQFSTAHGKTCPNFDVARWLAHGMEPPAEHTL